MRNIIHKCRSITCLIISRNTNSKQYLKTIVDIWTCHQDIPCHFYMSDLSCGCTISPSFLASRDERHEHYNNTKWFGAFMTSYLRYFTFCTGVLGYPISTCNCFTPLYLWIKLFFLLIKIWLEIISLSWFHCACVDVIFHSVSELQHEISKDRLVKFPRFLSK